MAITPDEKSIQHQERIPPFGNVRVIEPQKMLMAGQPDLAHGNRNSVTFHGEGTTRQAMAVSPEHRKITLDMMRDGEEVHTHRRCVKLEEGVLVFPPFVSLYRLLTAPVCVIRIGATASEWAARGVLPYTP